jgi:hypothetical protein
MGVFALSLGQLAMAAGMPEYTLRIKNHKFNPDVITIPANTKVRLIVINQDPTPEEFESQELHREKIIQGNNRGVVFIGPLKPGSYPFMGEFHADTAKGRIEVK